MTSSRRELEPPRGGTPPPARADVAGQVVELAPLARRAAERHLDEYPDERERYGAAGAEWCAHDLQWVLAWAAIDAGGERGYLDSQLAWLRELLAARDYPADRLARSVELVAEVASDREPLARRLVAAAASLRRAE